MSPRTEPSFVVTLAVAASMGLMSSSGCFLSGSSRYVGDLPLSAYQVDEKEAAALAFIGAEMQHFQPPRTAKDSTILSIAPTDGEWAVSRHEYTNEVLWRRSTYTVFARAWGKPSTPNPHYDGVQEGDCFTTKIHVYQDPTGEDTWSEHYVEPKRGYLGHYRVVDCADLVAPDGTILAGIVPERR